jgi:hypothetical protein
MSAAVGSAGAPAASAAPRTRALPSWWPVAALTLLAAGLRFGTLELQSFWYDEAFTPVHVLHASLWATLRGVAHTENSPPLWYVLAWADARVLGTGEVALRLPSALAGTAAVPVAWGIGRELSGRRAAALCAALVAVCPLFVWYGQEARAYGLFTLTAALAMLCFLRALSSPTGGRIAAFALAAAAALLTHYFAVFLVVPMVLWLLGEERTRRRALPAIGAIALVALALIPLVATQGGHGTQWIGRWPLGERVEAIPQYYLLGASGEPLGHGLELLVALPLLGAVALGLWGLLPEPAAKAERAARRARELRAVAVCGWLLAWSLLLPIVLAAAGADYLAPRNLIGAMVPLTALIAVLAASPAAGTAGLALGWVGVLALLAISVDVDLSPRLQRGDWRGLATHLKGAPADRVITTVELGAAPLEYYLPGLHNAPPGSTVTVREIDETGYAPLRPHAARPPAPGFRLVGRTDVDGLILLRFASPVPRAVAESRLRRRVITLAHPEVLVPRGTPLGR